MQMVRGVVSNEPWMLDKRIPIALVASIVMQTMAAIWWAASISARMSQFEATVMAMGDQNGRIIKLEASGEQTSKTLDRIEAKIDKSLETPVVKGK